MKKIFLFLLFCIFFKFSFCQEENLIESLKFKDTEIKVVIQAISQKAFKDGKKVNIIISPNVKGLVNVDLEKVDWQTALEAVLKTYDYGYEWIGKNIILVDNLTSLSERRKKEQEAKTAEPVYTRVCNLKFSKVEEVRPILERMLTSRGRITSDSRTNTLVITEVQSNFPILEEAISALDIITPQVLIEAKVIETDLDTTQKLGVRWNLGSSASLEPSTVISGSKRPIIWPFTPHSENKYLKNNDFSATSSGFSYGTLDATSLSVAMQILFTDSHTKILSMPKITTLDNHTATIEVVTEDPVPNYTYNTETGSWEISGYQWIKYGVYLEVTPQINKEGFITMNIKPRVSEKTSDKTFTSSSGSTASLPVLDTQTSLTNVMVKDRETLVMGGLIRDKIEEAVNKVPLLGDIPVLGYFFKHKSKATVKKNLLIFITPMIVTAQSENKN